MDCYKGETRKKALAAIARYNELCAKGVDEDFGKDPRILKVTVLKDPPFYASVRRNEGSITIAPGLCSTTGLDTDEDGRVLNKEFRPIKGLYAAGNNAGNRYIVVYQTPLCGISLGMAMTEGYMLGERLAAL
jgi:succinate dehydrogenase/fumarate reductase flavoprotein subunit